MATPFFSVVVPTYKQSRWIKNCIEGILAQTCTDFELIISDDSEDDATEKIVQSFSNSQIRYYRNNPRLGRVANYRTCVMERAAGQWCLICDGDDVITDINYLADVKEIIQQHPQLVFIQGGHLKGTTEKESVQEWPVMEQPQKLFTGLEYLLQFQQIAHFSHMSSVSKLSVLKTIDPFRLNILSSDIETYLRLVEQGSVYLMKRTVGLWRQHTQNASASTDYKVQLHNLQWIKSVSVYWNNRLTEAENRKVNSWAAAYVSSSVLYQFKQLLKKEDTGWKELIGFMRVCKKQGWAGVFLRSTTAFKLMVRFIAGKKN